MRVLLLGYDGFLGGLFAHYLLKRNDFEIIACGRSSREHKPSTVRKLGCDLSDLGHVRQLVESVRPDAVVNLAGATGGDARKLYLANAVVPANIAQGVLDAAPACRFVQLGSAAEYGPSQTIIEEGFHCHPISLYGHTKLAASRLLLSLREQRGLDATVVRPFNLIAESNSPNQVIGSFVDKVLADKRAGSTGLIAMGSLSAVRDFLWVEDLFLLLACILDGKNESCAVINACSGVGRETRELVEYLASKIPGIAVDEASELAASGSTDKVVGAPDRFLRITGLKQASPIEPVLDRVLAATGLRA